jgi:hypothetical protein
MTKDDFAETLRTVVPGQAARVPYEIFADWWPPGERDHRAQDECRAFAKESGFEIDNRPDDGAVWFVRSGRCPDCRTPLIVRPTTIDGGVYECPTHGIFGVAGTAEASGFWSEQGDVQRAALKRARGNLRPGDEFAVVTSYHV